MSENVVWKGKKMSILNFSLQFLSRSNHLEGNFPFLFPVSSRSKKFSPFPLLPKKVEILRTDKKFCQQKVEIPETDTKNSLPLSLPAKGGNPETRIKKFCQQKVEIPETDTKNSLPLSLPAKGGNSETRTKKNSASKKWKSRNRDKKSLSLPLTRKMVEYRPKEEQRRGKKTIMRRWRELLEKWNGKREGVQNEAKGGKHWN